MVLSWRSSGYVPVGTSKFEVIRRSLPSDHDPIEAVMVLKSEQYSQAEAFAVEADYFFKIIARPRDAEDWISVHDKLLARIGNAAKVGSRRLTSSQVRGNSSRDSSARF